MTQSAFAAERLLFSPATPNTDAIRRWRTSTGKFDLGQASRYSFLSSDWERVTSRMI